MSGLRRRGLNAMPAFHMVELLDAPSATFPSPERKMCYGEPYGNRSLSHD